MGGNKEIQATEESMSLCEVLRGEREKHITNEKYDQNYKGVIDKEHRQSCEFR